MAAKASKSKGGISTLSPIGKKVLIKGRRLALDNLAPPAKQSKKRGGHGARRPRKAPTDSSDQNSVDDQFVTALARGLQVLSAFRRNERRLGNQELSERTGFPKSTVSRLTHTLTKLGFLNFNARGLTYELGGAAISIGYAALVNIDVRRIAQPLMQKLADDSGFNVALGVCDRQMMIISELCEGKELVNVTLRPGSRIPIVTTALGRAYLATLSDEERVALLGEIKRQHGDEWPALVQGVTQAIKDINSHGFCLSLGDWRKDINGVGASIKFPEGQQSYALNFGGPAYLISAEKIMQEYGPRLATIAQKVEASINAN